MLEEVYDILRGSGYADVTATNGRNVSKHARQHYDDDDDDDDVWRILDAKDAPFIVNVRS